MREPISLCRRIGLKFLLSTCFPRRLPKRRPHLNRRQRHCTNKELAFPNNASEVRSSRAPVSFTRHTIPIAACALGKFLVHLRLAPVPVMCQKSLRASDIILPPRIYMYCPPRVRGGTPPCVQHRVCRGSPSTFLLRLIEREENSENVCLWCTEISRLKRRADKKCDDDGTML